MALGCFDIPPMPAIECNHDIPPAIRRMILSPDILYPGMTKLNIEHDRIANKIKHIRTRLKEEFFVSENEVAQLEALCWNKASQRLEENNKVCEQLMDNAYSYMSQGRNFYEIIEYLLT